MACSCMMVLRHEKPFLSTENGKLAQQLAEPQKYVATILRSVTKYISEPSSDIASENQELSSSSGIRLQDFTFLSTED